MPNETSAEKSSNKLINQTSDLRDDLLTAANKLEKYAMALQEEVARLKQLAADRRISNE